MSNGDMNTPKVIFFKENIYFYLTLNQWAYVYWPYLCYNQYNKLGFAKQMKGG